jgi:hypothetical protein
MGRAAAAVIFEHLGLNVLQRLIDGDQHVRRFGQTDQVSAAPLDRNFRDVAVLLDGQNDLALDVVAQDFDEFAEAGFHLVTNGGSDFILSAKIFYGH